MANQVKNTGPIARRWRWRRRWGWWCNIVSIMEFSIGCSPCYTTTVFYMLGHTAQRQANSRKLIIAHPAA
jgi:hypothetical protein